MCRALFAGGALFLSIARHFVARGCSESHEGLGYHRVLLVPNIALHHHKISPCPENLSLRPHLASSDRKEVIDLQFDSDHLRAPGDRRIGGYGRRRVGQSRKNPTVHDVVDLSVVVGGPHRDNRPAPEELFDLKPHQSAKLA